LKRWLEAANIISGAVFRRVTRWGAIGTEPLSDGSINDILEACAKAADLAYVPELSSHSLRRGLATSAHRSGADFKDIKRQGGWRHDGTVQGYIEEAGRFEANAALALLRRKGKNEA
jgi:integrase